tara:strand:- start:10015 stop:10887 length:873 start_codon:yes stop_codon:yes gene_type:complete
MSNSLSRALLLPALLLACTGAEDIEILEPTFGAKTDVSDAVSIEGVLAVNGEAIGSFEEDLSFQGYRFRVGEGAVIKLEVARKGSSSQLDTTLFIYRQISNTQFEPSALASDNDAGWGKLSRIEDQLLESGTYLAVVGTAMGLARGHYRLTLSCTGDCEPQPIIDGCPDEIVDELTDCVFDELSGSDDRDHAAAFLRCTDNQPRGFGADTQDIFENHCNDGGIAPDFCQLGLDAFRDEIVPDCVDEQSGILGENPACFDLDGICESDPCGDLGLLEVTAGSCSDGQFCCI